VADIDAKFLAARLICREPDAGTEMSIHPPGKVGHRYFEIPYRVIRGSACRNVPRIVENGKNMSWKPHGSPNGGLPAGVRDEFPR
jgi:hypothetical protein